MKIPMPTNTTIDITRMKNIICFFIDEETGQVGFSMNLSTHRPSDVALGRMVRFVEETLLGAARQKVGDDIIKQVKDN